MIRLLQWLFFGHIHKWKTLEHYQLVQISSPQNELGERYIQQCEHCGIVVKRDLI